VREHDADALYVHEQSRLTRGDELDVAMLMRELRERRVKLLVCGVVRDLDSIDERFMMRIQSVVDRAESERIVERSKRGKKEKARRGLWTSGNPPFGYRNPSKSDGCRGRLQIVPEQAAIVRRIFAMVAAGHTVNSIHETLNREGIAAGRGRWGNTTLHRMLTHPVYIGTLETNRWKHGGGRIERQPAQIAVDGAHEPIVDRATWDRVQARLNGRRNRGRSPAMLTGILHVNGLRMKADSNSVRAFYRAAGLHMQRDHADQIVWDGFTRLMRSTQWVDVIRQSMSDDHHADDRAAMAEQYRAAIARLDRRLDGLTTMRADGEIGKMEYAERTEAIRSQIQQARNALVGCTAERPDKGDELRQTASAIRAMLNRRVDVSHRRRLIEAVASRIDARAEQDKFKRWIIRDLRIGVMDQPLWSSASPPATSRLRFRTQLRRCPARRRNAPC
jgi:DNA invertase Pin-like site-specific DNA recombinase